MQVLRSMALTMAAIAMATISVNQTFAQSQDTTITLSPEEYNVIFAMRTVEETYVDKIPPQKLSEMAIKGITERLDPHTRLIGKNDLPEEIKIPRNGLGMECRSYKDTVTVVAVTEGGMAWTAGIRPGQRIAYINKNKVAGKIMSTCDIRKMLDAITADSAYITIYTKKNSEKLYQVGVDTCNNGGITAHYAPNDTTIYIKLSLFNRYTAQTFEKTINGYSKKKRRNLIIDLRDNLGGMWAASVEICKMLVPQGIRVAKAEGAHYENPPAYSEADGWLCKSRLYLLINENTASASEVVASCVQDCDRGVIIGRRSYGKALMQQRISMPSGEVLSITKARLLSPTERLVQKEYSKISREGYLMENRQRKAENISEDTMRAQIAGAETIPTKFNGREMPCGVGVVPDVFNPKDDPQLPEYWYAWHWNGLLEDFMYHFVNSHRSQLGSMRLTIHNMEQNIGYQYLLGKMEEYCKQDHRYGNAPENLSMDWGEPGSPTFHVMKNQLYAQLANALFGHNSRQQVLNQIDKDYQTAIQMIESPDLYYKALGNQPN